MNRIRDAFRRWVSIIRQVHDDLKKIMEDQPKFCDMKFDEQNGKLIFSTGSYPFAIIEITPEGKVRIVGRYSPTNVIFNNWEYPAIMDLLRTEAHDFG